MINDRESKTMGREIPLLVITGKQDMMSNYIGARKWIDSLEMASKTEPEIRVLQFSKAVFKDEGLESIYIKKHRRILHAEVESAGHMVGNTNPGVLAELIESFIKGDL